jgi:acyl-coenzyme A thioesterase PaaI-like protein
VTTVALARPGAGVVRRPRDLAAEILDLVLEEVSPGEAVFSTQSPEMATSGHCSTMLDFALSTAVQSLLAPGTSYRAVDLVVTAAPASQPSAGRLEASARVVSSGCGLLVASGNVRDSRGIRATGRLVAVATATSAA